MLKTIDGGVCHKKISFATMSTPVYDERSGCGMDDSDRYQETP